MKTFHFHRTMGCLKENQFLRSGGEGGIPRHVTCPLIKCKRNHVAALQSNTLLEIVDDKS